MEAIDFEVQVEQSEIKKNLNIPIFSEEKVGALFNQGHISKMSSIVKISDLTIDYTYQRQPIMKKVTIKGASHLGLSKFTGSWASCLS